MQFSSRHNLLCLDFPAKVSNYIYIFICPLGGPIVKTCD